MRLRAFHAKDGSAGRGPPPPPDPEAAASARRREQLDSRAGRREAADRDEAVAAAAAIAGAQAAADAAAVDVATATTATLLDLFSDLCAAGRLRDALTLMERASVAKRVGFLRRLRHKHFLGAAAAARSAEAAALALRFVDALPAGVADARTYTLALSAAAAARCAASAHAARDALRAARVDPDAIMHTTIVAAHAAAGSVDAAFDAYAEMRAAGVRTDARVYSALVAACARAMAALPPGPASRRTCLVLLERASGVLDDMAVARVRPDAPVWNALIGAAGRAGALQRAFAALDDMKAAGVPADDRTYVALIEGCGRAGRRDLAVRVYHSALRAGAGDASPLLYTATVAACRGDARTAGAGPGAADAAADFEPAAGGAGAATPGSQRSAPRSPLAAPDLPTALEVYRDMERAGVAPDARMYAALIGVAGAARDLSAARALVDDAAADGLAASPEVVTALVIAAVDAGDVDAGLEALATAEASGGRPPAARAYSAVINATGVAWRLPDAVRVLGRMAAARVPPDAFTVAALLNGLQRAGEADAAFDVFYAARARGVPVDDAVAFILLRLCYNKLRSAWFPGGYPPGRADAAAAAAGGAASATLRADLSAALGAPPAAANSSSDAAAGVDWATRAVGVYRDALECGVRPSPRLLDRVLACLRLPHDAPHAARGSGGGGEGGRGSPARAVFDPRALPIIDDAIAAGVLPPVSLPPPAPVLDLRGMPPCVAEVYVLAVAAALARAVDGPRALSDVTLLVPPYDPAEIFFPSYAHEEPGGARGAAAAAAAAAAADERAAAAAAAATDLEAAADAAAEPRPAAPAPAPPPLAAWPRAEHAHGGSTTQPGLGVAAMLRRIGLWAAESPADGAIRLQAKEVARWVRAAAARADVTPRSPALGGSLAGGRGRGGAASLAAQSRAIRVGGGGGRGGRGRGAGAARAPGAPGGGPWWEGLE